MRSRPSTGGSPIETASSSETVRSVADRYSGQAEAYRRYWAQPLFEAGLALVERIPLAESRAVVEVGTGVGVLLAEIRRRATGAFLVGVDVAEGMIRLAPADIPRAVMNAARLGFPDGSFDAAVMAFMLFHVPDPSEGLAEVHRVLRPKGTLGVATWEAVNEDLEPDLIWNALLDEHGAAPDELPPAHHDLMDTPDKVRGLLEHAGFEVAGTEVMELIDRFDTDEFLARRTTLGATKRRFASLPEDARTACLDEARERLAGLPDEAFEARDRAILAWARRP